VVVGEALYPEMPEPGHRVPRRVVRELTERLGKELQVVLDRARINAGE
jgi:hypothetical protein